MLFRSKSSSVNIMTRIHQNGAGSFRVSMDIEEGGRGQLSERAGKAWPRLVQKRVLPLSCDMESI